VVVELGAGAVVVAAAVVVVVLGAVTGLVVGSASGVEGGRARLQPARPADTLARASAAVATRTPRRGPARRGLRFLTGSTRP